MWTLSFLASRVHTDGWTTEDGTGVDHDVAVVDRNRKAIHAAWCRTALLLADTVELRTVARALEPL
jgi:hypothetical protein